MAKTPKVRLYLYMRTRSTEGRDVFLDPAWNQNHTLRAGYALAHGKPKHHSEGIYYDCSGLSTHFSILRAPFDSLNLAPWRFNVVLIFVWKRILERIK